MFNKKLKLELQNAKETVVKCESVLSSINDSVAVIEFSPKGEI